jgi:hypothetical protein
MTMSAKHLLVALTILAATPAVPQAAQTEKKPAAVTLAPQQRAEEDKQLLGLIALTAAPLLPPVMAQDHPPATPASKKPTVAQASPQHEDDGQRLFEQLSMPQRAGRLLTSHHGHHCAPHARARFAQQA